MMPLLRVNRHMVAISLRQEYKVLPKLDQLRQAGLAQLLHSAQEILAPAGSISRQQARK